MEKAEKCGIIKIIQKKGGFTMNKLSKIFLLIIIVLTITLGIMTYYCLHFRKLYFSSADEAARIAEIMESSGYHIEIEE